MRKVINCRFVFCSLISIVSTFQSTTLTYFVRSFVPLSSSEKNETRFLAFFTNKPNNANIIKLLFSIDARPVVHKLFSRIDLIPFFNRSSLARHTEFPFGNSGPTGRAGQLFVLGGAPRKRPEMSERDLLTRSNPTARCLRPKRSSNIPLSLQS